MILFRADGNASIGSGHIMRCLSIADAFKRKQKDSLFVLADTTFQSLIKDRGYETYILDSDYRDMDSELDNMKKAIAFYHPEMIIADSYYVTKYYLQELKELAHLVYVDDLAAFAYPVDVLVNYNVYGPDVAYKTLYINENVTLPKLVLGLRYAPLREMFCNVPVRKQNKTVEDVLISTGGADPIHLALKLAQHIAQSTYPQRFHFLVGAMNADYDEIINTAAKRNNIFVHHNVKDMKTLISSCDLAVSAAGSTTYEISACGVPMITYVLADNQIQGAKALEKLGMAISCGDLRNVDKAARRIMDAVALLADDFTLRKNMGKRMRKLVDGNGADRLVEELLKQLVVA